MVDVTATFSGPHEYDRCLGPAYFESYAVDLALRLPQRPPGDVLEIACGTGIVTRQLRERLDPSRRLVATDISKAMLDYARDKTGRRDGIEWHEADAMQLPFENGAFGSVVCGFGIMFVPDRAAMLREARRVLVKDGLLLFTVWDRIENNPAAAANAEVVESLFPGDAEMRFRIPYDMHDAGYLKGLLAGAGFRALRIETRRIAIQNADPLAIATGQIRGSPRSVLLEKRGASIDAVIGKIAEVLRNRGGNPYNSHAQAVVVEACAT